MPREEYLTNGRRFEELYRHYYRMAVAVAQSFLKNKEAAEDAAQDSFLKIFKNMNRIQEIQSNETKKYLYITVKNTCLDVIRKEKVAFEPWKEEGAWTEDATKGPLEQLVEKEGGNQIVASILELGNTYRTVSWLKFICGWSDREIAGILGLPLKTVTMRAYRAKKILRAKLLSKFH